MKFLFVWLGFFLTATVGQNIERHSSQTVEALDECGWLVEGFFWDDTHCSEVVKPNFIDLTNTLASHGPNFWKQNRDLSNMPTLQSKVKDLQSTFEAGTPYLPTPIPFAGNGKEVRSFHEGDFQQLYPSFMITREQYRPRSERITNCFGLKLTTKFQKPKHFRKHGADRFMDNNAEESESRRQVVVDFEYSEQSNLRCAATSECRIHFINGKPSISRSEVFNFATEDKAVSMYYFFGPGETVPWLWETTNNGDSGHLWNGQLGQDSLTCTPLDTFDISFPSRCRGVFFVYVRYVWDGQDEVDDWGERISLVSALNASGPSSALTTEIWEKPRLARFMIVGNLPAWEICGLATFKNFKQSRDSAYVKQTFDPVIGNEMGIYSDSLEISTTLFGAAKSSKILIYAFNRPWSRRPSFENWEDAVSKFIVDPCGRVDHMGRGANIYDDKIAKVMCYSDLENQDSEQWIQDFGKQCVSPESQRKWRNQWGPNSGISNGIASARHSYCLGYVDYVHATEICADLRTLETWTGGANSASIWTLPDETTDFSKCCYDGISNDQPDSGRLGTGSLNSGVSCTRNWESSMIWTSITWTQPSEAIIDFLGADFYDSTSDTTFGKPRETSEPNRAMKLELTTISGPQCITGDELWALEPKIQNKDGFNLAWQYAGCEAVVGPGEELKLSLSYDHAFHIGSIGIGVTYKVPTLQGNEFYETSSVFRIGIHQGLYMQIYLNDDPDPFSASPYHSVFLDRGSINFDIVDIDSYLPETIQSSKWGVLLKGSFRTTGRGEFCNLGLYSPANTKSISAKWDGQIVNTDVDLFNPLDGDSPFGKDKSGRIYWQEEFVQDRFYDYEFKLWDETYPRLLWLDLRWWCESHKLLASRDIAVSGRFHHPNFEESIPPVDSDFVYLHRIVPRECFVSRSGSPVYASPPAITNGTCDRANSVNHGIVSVDYALYYPPTSDVVITFTSELPIDVCSMTFTPTNYNVAQTLQFSTSYTAQENHPNGQNLHITGTASSNDPKFDGFDISVPVEAYEESCFNVQNFSSLPHACFVSVDGAVKSFSDWEMREPRQVEKHSYVWLIKDDANNFHIQARADQCSGQACVTSATIYYHGDVYSVYKEVNNQFLTLNHLANMPPTGPILDLVEDGDCWIFSSANGIRAEFCVVDRQFVDIFVYIAVGALLQNPSVEGLCFGDLTAGYPDATSCNLNFFPEIKPPSNPNLKPFLPSSCAHIDTGSRTHIRQLLPASAQAISTKRIKLIRDVDIKRYLPRELNKLCSTPGYIKAMGGNVKDLLLGEPGKTTCERLHKSGHKLQVAQQSSRQLVYGIVQYFLWTGGMDNDPAGSMFKNYVANNPRLCGPFAEAKSTGCQCKDGGDFPDCTGVTFDGGDPNNAKQRCPSYVSVIVDQYTGQVWKCFKGYCQYSYNGAHWTGMPKNLKTPYCIVAISWSDSDRTQDQTLWAISNTGLDIASTDRGITWSVLTHNWDTKQEKMPAVTSFASGHSNEAALVIDGVSRVVPHDAFPGRGSDRWWLTPQELCVQSESLSAWHDVMVSCSKWFCQCVDPDEWLSTFGIPVPGTPDAPVNETIPVSGPYIL